MHQNTANHRVERAAFLVFSPEGFVQKANRCPVIPGKGELRCVVKNQNWRVGSGKAAPCGGKMSGENGSFVHPGIGQEAVSGLGVAPVLAGKRNTFAKPGRELLQKL